MPLFGRKKEGDSANASGPTAGKIFGAIFNPCPGVLSPIGDTVAVFAYLLAYIFGVFGLFPAEHPVFTKGGRQNVPTVGQVFATAWSRLSFTRHNIPQICLFFGLIAGLAAGVIAFFVTIFSVMVGTAHAAAPTQTYYSPVDSTNDMALNWINYLFKGKELPNYLSGIGQHVPQSCLIQGAFIVALGFYSNAILVVAAIILFYHLASMIVETAHHGKVMGKDSNEIWAPIRLVVAIGLLVPITSYRPESTCAGFGGANSAGLNSGQYIVIKVAEWGSNLGSQVWKRFIKYISEETYTGVGPVPPMAQAVVYNTMMRVACVEIYNAYFNGLGGNKDDKCALVPAKESMPGLSGEMVGTYKEYADGSTGFIYDFKDKRLADDGVCGGYSFIPITDSSNPLLDGLSSKRIVEIRTKAYQNMVTEATKVVRENFPNFVHVCVGGKDESALPLNKTDPFTSTMNKYIGDLKGDMADNAKSFSEEMKRVAEISGRQGWVSAGAWFNTISRAQGALMETTGLLPSTSLPKINLSGDPLLSRNVWPAMEIFNDWLAATHTEATKNDDSGLASYEERLNLASAGIKRAQGEEQRENILDNILAQIDIIAAWNGVWSPAFGKGKQPTGDEIRKYGTDNKSFTLGVQFGDNINPLAEMTRLGHANIKTAYMVFDFYWHLLTATGTIAMAAQATGGGVKQLADTVQQIPVLGRVLAPILGTGAHLSNAFGHLSNGVKTAIGGMISSIFVIFLTSGTLLAYLLPMIPFFSFLFGVVTWVVSLLEAVICIPLVALAHLTPDGKGLPGPKALAAYHFLFNIFLRPVLMVFALMVALLIFYVAASYLNLFFVQAVVGAGGIAHGHAMFTRLIYSILYCAILYIIGKNCFKIITLLPTHAMKWGGMQNLTFHELGDAGALTTYTTLAQQKISGDLMKSVGSMQGPEALMLRSWMEHPQGNVKDNMTNLGEAARLFNDAASPLAARINRNVAEGLQDVAALAKNVNERTPHAPTEQSEAHKEAIGKGKEVIETFLNTAMGRGTGQQQPQAQTPNKSDAKPSQDAAPPDTPLPSTPPKPVPDSVDPAVPISGALPPAPSTRVAAAESTSREDQSRVGESEAVSQALPSSAPHVAATGPSPTETRALPQPPLVVTTEPPPDSNTV